jgi:hypothetical protein
MSLSEGIGEIHRQLNLHPVADYTASIFHNHLCRVPPWHGAPLSADARAKLDEDCRKSQPWAAPVPAAG